MPHVTNWLIDSVLTVEVVTKVVALLACVMLSIIVFYFLLISAFVARMISCLKLLA